MGLVLDSVDKVVEREVYLENVNLDLKPGSRYVVLGRTLAGKTTLLRIMAGLDRPTRGRVLVNGEDVTGHSVRKRDVAMVYQQFINYPSLTVYENIASPLKIRGYDKAETDKRVRTTADMLHLTSMLDRLPAELSGGQQQRTAIARALVMDVELLLLDEPLVNLDYKLREELREELQDIFEQRESIVVYTTTEPTEALMLGGDVLVMHEGRVLQTGKTPEVYQYPATTKVAEVFSDPPINFLGASVNGANAELSMGIDLPLDGHLAGLESGSYTFGVRSNRFHLLRQTERDIAIESTIELSEVNGSETFVHFHYHDRTLVVQEEGIRNYKVDEKITVYVQPKDFYVFGGNGELVKAPADTAARSEEA